MSGVLPEHAFVEIVEGRLAVDVVGDDPGPVVGAAVAGGPLGEPLEFAGCVTSIVPTVAAAAFPLVLEVALEAVVERRRKRSVRHSPALHRPAGPVSEPLPWGKRRREAVAAFVLHRQRRGT
ncbi:hypothetical protein [Halolamina salina]|uniref:Uncharacterized protein n=1 Tax=Halolamina salina TaxID=1220023 RepID=A0ABD6BBB2_9EURY